MTRDTGFIKIKLLSSFIFLCLVPILCISLYNYYQIKSQIINSTLAQTQALVKIKSLQVDRFYKGIDGELKTIASLPVIKNISTSNLKQHKVPLSGKDMKVLTTEVLRQFTINKDFDELYIFGLDGEVLASYMKGTERTARINNAIMEGRGKTCFSDIYIDHNGSRDYLFTASTPVKDYNNKPIGVIVAEVSANSLFERIQDYTGLGNSGETLLGKKVGDEVVFLNPLRHDKNAAFVRKVNITEKIARPIIDGASGKNGFGESIDYRGVDVIASWGYIPTNGWGIVAKIDTDEALRPLNDARNSIIITAMILLVFGIVASMRMAINFMRPVEVLEKAAHIDSLTGLPNRKLLMLLLDQVLNKARLNDTMVAIMFVDLDGFKAVNDTFGHETGDLLLKNVGSRLTNCVRKSDTVARLGGDEFIVLISGAQDIGNITKIASTFIKTLREEFVIQGNLVNIGASIGISVFPGNASNANEMIKQADHAMYEAKNSGKNNFKFFELS